MGSSSIALQKWGTGKECNTIRSGGFWIKAFSSPFLFLVLPCELAKYEAIICNASALVVDEEVKQMTGNSSALEVMMC